MSTPIVGVLVCLGLVFLFMLLFRVEEARGGRFFERNRRHFDFLILKLDNSFGKMTRLLGSDLFRQSIHYFFHAVLLSISRLLATSEDRVETMLRSNHLLAKKARRERTTRNKFDEIAEHQASVAFTDEERQRHKDEALER